MKRLEIGREKNRGASFFVYDGDCSFCHSTAMRLAKGNVSFEIITSQKAGPLLIKHTIDPQRAAVEAIWIDSHGKSRFGAFAISAALSQGGIFRRSLSNLIELSFLRPVIVRGYSFIAKRRRIIGFKKSQCTLYTQTIDSRKKKVNGVNLYLWIQFLLPAILFALRCPPINKTLAYEWGWMMFS